MKSALRFVGLALLLALLLAFSSALAACASATPPGDDGTGELGSHGEFDLAGVDLAGLDLAGIDLAGFVVPVDMAHTTTGIPPAGTWTAITSPADLVGASPNSSQPVLTLYNDQPAIAWIEVSDVRVATYDGTAWHLLGAALNALPGNSAGAVQIAGRNGKLDVAFIERSPGGATTSSAYVYTWTSPSWVAVGAPVTLQLSFLGDLALALSSTGLPYIGSTQQVSGTSSGPSNIFVSRYNGTSWSSYGSSIAAEGGSSSALAAKLQLDDSDKLYVAWEETFVHLYIDDGSWTPVGPNNGRLASAAASSSYEQEIAVDHLQRPVVARMEYDTNQADIYVARWNGASWDQLTATPLSAQSVAGSNAALSAIAIDGVDAPVVAWTENDASNVYACYVKRLTGGTSAYLGQPLTLPSGYQYLGPPQLVVDSYDNVTLVFTGQRISDSKNRLFVYRYR